jgi:hypothetical protein
MDEEVGVFLEFPSHTSLGKNLLLYYLFLLDFFFYTNVLLNTKPPITNDSTPKYFPMYFLKHSGF